MKYILSIVLFAGAFTSCSFVFNKPVRFEGGSMLPTYANGDRILVSRRVGELKRGDVIAHEFPLDRSKSYIKRIVGLPGESIAIINGVVIINDKPLKEPYIDGKYNEHRLDFKPMPVPSDSYFVLGDNRDNSSDSRSWGPVKYEMIIGKVVKKY